MGEASPARLRTLAAEIRHELPRIARTVDEIALVRGLLAVGTPASDEPRWRLAVYASAALLETYYTGVEMVMRRIAAATSGVPIGAAWHRDLLHSMTVDVPRVRPAVLSDACAASLERYLAFRRRFRNLCLFELDSSLLVALLAGAPTLWADTRAALEAFAAALDAVAEGLEA